MKTLAIIPARSGSKGLPRKNVRELGGRPLMCWSIDAGLKAESVDRVVVSTEDRFTAEIARHWGAEHIPRPRELATDTASTDSVILHALHRLAPFYQPDIVVLLQPTSPFRPDGLIDDCIKRLVESGADSLVTVYRGPHFFWHKRGETWLTNCDPAKERVARQDISPELVQYAENGNVYVTHYQPLMETARRVCGKVECYEMNRADSIEIDEDFDFWLSEQRIVRDAFNKSVQWQEMAANHVG